MKCFCTVWCVGLPRSLECVPSGPVNVENRTPLQLAVHVKDTSGNLTTDSQLKLVCKVQSLLDMCWLVGWLSCFCVGAAVWS